MNAPTLQADRVEAMRGAVMAAVDTDIRRRRQRTRRLAAGVVAAAAVVVVGGVGAALMGGGDTTFSASDSGASAAEVAPAPVTDPAAADDRQVIRTGSVTVVAADPRKEVRRISDRVEALGGRIDSRNESGSGSSASAYLTVRVPSSRLTQAVDQLSSSGEVVSVTLQNDDVTSTVVDLDARLRALKISIDRLEKILSEADSSAAVVAAEDALTQRQSQLEELTSQRDALDEDVEMARLDIEIVQKEQIDDVDTGGFVGGLTRGWNALVGAVNGLVEGAGAVLPWAAVAALGYGVFRLVRRFRRRAGTPHSTRA